MTLWFTWRSRIGHGKLQRWKQDQWLPGARWGRTDCKGASGNLGEWKKVQIVYIKFYIVYSDGVVVIHVRTFAKTHWNVCFKSMWFVVQIYNKASIKPTERNKQKQTALPQACTALKIWTGTSLVVQWLRPCITNAGGPGLIPGQGTISRSHMSQLRVLN